MVSNPPISYLTVSEARALDLHNHQVFDMIASSGQHVPLSAPQDLYITDMSGSGPIYNVTFHTSTNIASDICIGDMYISVDYDGETTSWYRYDIVSVSSTSPTDVDAQVKYVGDSEDWGSASPSDVKLSSETQYDVTYHTRAHILCRRVNVDALLMF